MRALVYNIAYGTGHTGAPSDHIRKAHRFLRTSHAHLEKIGDFISGIDPDVIGLVEVDIGSSRTKYINQAEEIASRVNHYHTASVKYNHRHIARNIPIIRKQANAILTKKKIPPSNFHFFPVGVKQLIIEADIGGLRFFLVHLSLMEKTRRRQVEHLIEIASGDKPVIIAGDFNVFSGRSELGRLEKRLNLYNPNTENHPTFPSCSPRKELDFILCSKRIRTINFSVVNVNFSDHLPIVLDFEL
jgi:endonuclease/exonuclease/phosphatase family metal-dependent hydrolase